MSDPPERYGVVDFVVDGISAQAKMAATVTQGLTGLHVDLRKSAGMTNGQKHASKQPYGVDDPIHAFIIYVQKNDHLCVFFIIPFAKAIEMGWIKGNGRRGKVTGYVQCTIY